AHLFVDGALLREHLDGGAVPVNPGNHTFRFEAEGRAPIELKVLVTEGEQGRLLTATFPAATQESPPDRRLRAASASPSTAGTPFGVYAFAATAGLALGVFGYFEVKAQVDYGDLKDGCGRSKTCTASQVDPLRTEFVVAVASLGVGALAAAGAVG